MPLHRFKRDQVIALSYAAEQLFIAAQLLTSDTVPLDYALPKSCDHLRRLLEHRALLPSYLITWISECIESCRRPALPAGKLQPQQLAGAILEVLEDVRRVLNEAQNGPALEVQSHAA